MQYTTSRKPIPNRNDQPHEPCKSPASPSPGSGGGVGAPAFGAASLADSSCSARSTAVGFKLPVDMPQHATTRQARRARLFQRLTSAAMASFTLSERSSGHCRPSSGAAREHHQLLPAHTGSGLSTGRHRSPGARPPAEADGPSSDLLEPRHHGHNTATRS